ncbi:hypothetical protein [Crateriforma spongiae]|uniref:hypothetical protein n=1 Tax=Crateriforma spongiae TaxID=2724528 RepID=UPI0039B0DDF6
MSEQDTKYSNTDLDLKSRSSLELLASELQSSCCVLHCAKGDDGNWHMTVESDNDLNTCDSNDSIDIPLMLESISKLSPAAKHQFDACYFRDFNIGVECWDTWAYNHVIPAGIVRKVADAGCSLSVTLYPGRRPDGTPRTDENGG